MNMERIWALLLTICAVLLTVTSATFTVDEETRLREDLMTNYSRTVRPSAQTIIEMSFQLTAISSIDLKNQHFKVAGWWSMHWSDSRLSWTQSDYNGIPVVQIFEDMIWTPVVVVDNSIDNLGAIDEDTIPLRVDSTGQVNWNPPGLISVNCDMDITHFPFDSQVCALQVTSFGYTIQELDIYQYEGGISLTYYGGDGEWSMIKTWNDRATYSEGDYEYARVYFYFQLKRKPLFYGLNYLLPVIVTAALTVFVFLLPAESGEKIGYCLTVLLAFMVILTLIAADLPTTAANTSLLELYIAVVLIMGALSVVLSIYVLELYHRPDDHPIPEFVQTLTVLGMRINCYKTTCCCRRKVEPEEGPEDRYAGHGNGATFYNGSGYYSGDKTKPDRRNPSEKQGPPLQKPELKRKQTTLSLRPITVQSSRDDESRGGEITWQTVSIVLDGILLRFYILFLTVSSIVFVALLVEG